MSEGYKVAVVGATGVVGEAIVDGLAERNFPVSELHVVASEHSEGKTLLFKNKTHRIATLADFDFSQVDIAFFTAGTAVSKEFVPRATEQGCIVIDNTSCFRYEKDVPLVIPQVNPDAIAQYTHRRLIANPNCSTIQMLVALNPVQQAVGITAINVATYQAVSGSGRAGISELASQTSQLLNGSPITDASVYPKQIAFNVIPLIDSLQDNDFTREEMKMVWETQKIFQDEHVLVNPTAVRVPVFFGHALATHIETREPLTVADARALISKAPGVTFVDEHSEVVTPVSEGANQDAVFVSRLRANLSVTNGLNMWVVADNVRKGAATNSIEIAEILVKDYL